MRNRLAWRCFHDCEPLNAIAPNGYKSPVDVLRYGRLTFLYTVTQVIHVETDARSECAARTGLAD